MALWDAGRSASRVGSWPQISGTWTTRLGTEAHEVHDHSAPPAVAAISRSALASEWMWARPSMAAITGTRMFAMFSKVWAPSS
jgi:hypothetical protein